MAIEILVNYTVSWGNTSVAFSGPPGLTVEQIRTYLAGVGVDVPDLADVSWDAKSASISNVRARFMASAIANKTPQEIYSLVQGRIDGWTNLAQAKADLREWLPLMAAAIAWLVVDQD